MLTQKLHLFPLSTYISDHARMICLRVFSPSNYFTSYHRVFFVWKAKWIIDFELNYLNNQTLAWRSDAFEEPTSLFRDPSLQSSPRLQCPDPRRHARRKGSTSRWSSRRCQRYVSPRKGAIFKAIWCIMTKSCHGMAWHVIILNPVLYKRLTISFFTTITLPTLLTGFRQQILYPIVLTDNWHAYPPRSPISFFRALYVSPQNVRNNKTIFFLHKTLHDTSQGPPQSNMTHQPPRRVAALAPPISPSICRAEIPKARKEGEVSVTFIQCII